MVTLPIDVVLPQLGTVMSSTNNAVLIAPPGAGKTTRVPLALLDQPWLAGRRILLLEPRRLAARAAAQYMARALGEQVGATVGYRVRLDSKVGPTTRIEVITEGVLTRLLQSDAALTDVGLVIFDEFHERSLQADLGLALCLESQAVIRPDLRLLIMSATLEAQPVAGLLGDAPIIVSEGRTFPVATHYLPQPITGRFEPVLVRMIMEALRTNTGDVLVFLPGAGEIHYIERMMAESGLPQGVYIAPLYGNLPQAAQEAALAPSPPGTRKVVLATSLVETSLTVEGVRVVIDSGLMRVPRFSPRTGMTRLETVRVSKASADQRRGRAGRLGPGVCYRLWTEKEHGTLEAFTPPEILQADLASLALELAVWGVKQPSDLSWLNEPPPAAFAQARELLRQLGALNADNTVTAHGRRMAESGLHPRLAHMIIRAVPLGLGGLACELAALLSERDIFRGPEASGDVDVRHRVTALRHLNEASSTAAALPLSNIIDVAACRRMQAEVRHLRQVFALDHDQDNDVNACGLLLALAYPDRIGQRRADGRYLLRNGRGAVLPSLQPLSAEPYLVAAQLNDQGVESKVLLAAPITEHDLTEHFAAQIAAETDVTWDSTAHRVRARAVQRLGAIILKQSNLAASADKITAVLLQGIAQHGLGLLPWTRAARQLQQRIEFMRQFDPTWPDVSDEQLIATLPDWLGPYVYGLESAEDLKQLNMAAILADRLTREQRRQLDEWAPTHITVPSGQRLPINYDKPESPLLSVRLQEMFGLKDTPRIAGGRMPLTLELLSPAQRPVQVTKDLASFWRTTYFDVKKDLKGRYPKHYWPDDPLTAVATHRVRPRA